jgi:hypothetical protein
MVLRISFAHVAPTNTPSNRKLQKEASGDTILSGQEADDLSARNCEKHGEQHGDGSRPDQGQTHGPSESVLVLLAESPPGQCLGCMGEPVQCIGHEILELEEYCIGGQDGRAEPGPLGSNEAEHEHERQSSDQQVAVD